MKKILCTGDSHCLFWGGENTLTPQKPKFAGLSILHLGAVTAYNINSETSQAKALLKFHLDERASVYGAIVLCMGEIDCRAHIVKQAIKTGRHIAEVVQEVVARYMGFVDWLVSDYGLPVIILGPGASAPPDNPFSPTYPAIGSVYERNFATKVFNRLLMIAAQSRKNVAHFTLFDDMIDQNWRTLPQYLYDGCHISNQLILVAARKLEAALIKLGCHDPLPALNPARISPKPLLKNIAKGRSPQPSSTLPGERIIPFPEEPEADFCFHTQKQQQPYIIIDLGAVFPIHSVILYNRRFSGQERARSIGVGCALTDQTVIELTESGQLYDFSDTTPLVLPVKEVIFSRFIQIWLREENYFHLSTVKIFAYLFDRE